MQDADAPATCTELTAPLDSKTTVAGFASSPSFMHARASGSTARRALVSIDAEGRSGSDASGDGFGSGARGRSAIGAGAGAPPPPRA